MTSHKTDKVLVNPTADIFAAELTLAQDRANKGARARTAEFGTDYIVELVASSPEGADQTDGGGVPNSYQQRAETTVVGVAWWTAPNGDKHVRIYANRVDAPKSAYGRRSASAFVGETPLLCTFPSLWVRRLPLKLKKTQEYQFRDILDTNPLDIATRAAFADWLSEQNREREASEQRQALTLAQSLAVVEQVA